MIALYDSGDSIPFYYKRFNENGNEIEEYNKNNFDINEKLFEKRTVSVQSNLNTVTIGQEVKITITLNGENYFSAKAIIGEYNQNGNIDNKQKEISLKEGKVTFRVKPNILGKYEVMGIVELKDLFGEIKKHPFMYKIEVVEKI